MKLSMGGRMVGDGEPCFIVAEIGENFIGDVDIACAMIREAAKAGADAVKFQTSRAEELFSPSSSDYAGVAREELPLSDYAQALEAASANNVIFFSTPFDEPSADFLDDLGVPFFKIGSGELTHHALLRHVARKGKPMIVSTGMSDVGQIDAALRVTKDAGNEQVILTHCTSVYPAHVALANVRAVPALRELKGVLVGFSDHTMSNTAALTAVALGACYVEKHFTISQALPEGDNEMSAEPEQFSALVQGIREVEAALGVGERSLLPEEVEIVKLARRGVYARVRIGSGQRIKQSMLAVRRPLSEIAADQIDRVVGATVKTDIAAEDPLRWGDIDE